jgi:hypothetical protein
MRHRRRGWEAALIGAVLAIGVLCAPSSRTFALADPCPEPNDTPATACELNPDGPIQGFIDRSGDLDAYRILIAGAGQIQVDLVDLPADYDLYLTDPNGAVIGQSVREGTTPERLQLTVQPGAFFAVVRADLSREVDPHRPYTLSLTLISAVGGAPASARPPPTAMPTPTAADIVFADNFDNATAGLFPKVANDPARMEIGYVDGEYMVRKIDPTWDRSPVVTVPALAPFTDTVIEVDVRLVGDTPGRHILISCRSRNNHLDYYRLSVDPHQGRFQVALWLNSRQVSPANWQPSAAIRKDNASNRIAFTCSGSTLAASINGEKVYEIQDQTLPDGFARFGAGTPSEAPNIADARFDNLVVRRP